MTANHSSPLTLPVAIDISKHRQELLIRIPGEERHRFWMAMNALEFFQRLSRGPCQLRLWHKKCRRVGAFSASVHTIIWLKTMAGRTACGTMDVHDFFSDRRRIVRCGSLFA